jgi:hypothetical protein
MVGSLSEMMKLARLVPGVGCAEREFAGVEQALSSTACSINRSFASPKSVSFA